MLLRLGRVAARGGRRRLRHEHRRPRAAADGPDATGLRLHDPDLPEPDRAHAAATSAAGRSSQVLGARGITIVEDDPYALIRFEGEALPAIFDYAGKTSIYMSSFSKTDRAGAARRLDDPAGAARRRADRGCGLDLHHAVACEPGDRARVHRARQLRAEPAADERAARRRGATRCSPRSTKHFSGAKWTRPEGGYFVWLEAPLGDELRRGARRAREGVTAVHGPSSAPRRAACASPTASLRRTRSRSASSGSPPRCSRGAGLGTPRSAVAA